MEKRKTHHQITHDSWLHNYEVLELLLERLQPLPILQLTATCCLIRGTPSPPLDLSTDELYAACAVCLRFNSSHMLRRVQHCLH